MVFNKPPPPNGLFHQVKADARSNGKDNDNNWRRPCPHPIGRKFANHKKKGLKAMSKELFLSLKM